MRRATQEVNINLRISTEPSSKKELIRKQKGDKKIKAIEAPSSSEISAISAISKDDVDDHSQISTSVIKGEEQSDIDIIEASFRKKSTGKQNGESNSKLIEIPCITKRTATSVTAKEDELIVNDAQRQSLLMRNDERSEEEECCCSYGASKLHRRSYSRQKDSHSKGFTPAQWVFFICIFIFFTYMFQCSINALESIEAAILKLGDP